MALLKSEDIEEGYPRFHKIAITIDSLIIGDFGAGAVLITLGIILGKCNLHQLTILSILMLTFFSLNEAICVIYYGVTDMGGTMFVHTFGAYFGMGATYFFQAKEAIQQAKEGTTN